MHYYSVSYRIFPRELREDVETNMKLFFLFGSKNKLGDAEIKYALEYYLKENKENYTKLIITESKEIAEQEYIDRTQYT